MHNDAELRILFPTSFSDACFRTGRAIAQLADTCRVSLTIAHVARPHDDLNRKQQELNSFLAEADHYDRCDRLLLIGDDPVKAISECSAKLNSDLIVAPASDRLGLHRLLRPSFRAGLLRNCTAPLWTMGAKLDRAAFRGGIRTVACILDFDRDSRSYLSLALSFATRMGARLRIVHVVQPIDEYALASSVESCAPLMPELAVQKIREVFAGHPCPEIDVAVGDPARELPRLLEQNGADVVFAGRGQALCGVGERKLSRFLDRLPCPAICVDGASARFRSWNFDKPAEAVPQTVPARVLDFRQPAHAALHSVLTTAQR